MMGYSTTSSGDNDCQTGCPYCGCSNPNCRYSTVDFVVSRFEAVPAEHLILPYERPAWLVEQRQLPRRLARIALKSRRRPARAVRRCMRPAPVRARTAAHRMGMRRQAS